MQPTIPYRETSPDASQGGAPPEFVYLAPGGPESAWFVMLAAFVARLVALARGRRPEPLGDPRRIALRVLAGELSVSFGAREVLRRPLDRLLDVELDSRAVHRVQPSVRPDGTMHAAGSVLVDESRIQFVLAEPGVAFALGEAFGSYSQQLEAMAKMRTFLRRHGWLPDSERPQS